MKEVTSLSLHDTTLSISQSDFMGIVSLNLIVLRSFNYQNLI